MHYFAHFTGAGYTMNDVLNLTIELGDRRIIKDDNHKSPLTSENILEALEEFDVFCDEYSFVIDNNGKVYYKGLLKKDYFMVKCNEVELTSDELSNIFPNATHNKSDEFCHMYDNNYLEAVINIKGFSESLLILDETDNIASFIARGMLCNTIELYDDGELIASTFGHFLNKCEPLFRERIIDKLISFQTEDIELPPVEFVTLTGNRDALITSLGEMGYSLI